MQTTITEQNIIDLIREGKTNKEIASVINISVRAIENRIHRLLRKHKCRNRVELVVKVPRGTMET